MITNCTIYSLIVIIFILFCNYVIVAIVFIFIFIFIFIFVIIVTMAIIIDRPSRSDTCSIWSKGVPQRSF